MEETSNLVSYSVQAQVPNYKDDYSHPRDLVDVIAKRQIQLHSIQGLPFCKLSSHTQDKPNYKGDYLHPRDLVEVIAKRQLHSTQGFFAYSSGTLTG